MIPGQKTNFSYLNDVRLKSSKSSATLQNHWEKKAKKSIEQVRRRQEVTLQLHVMHFATPFFLNLAHSSFSHTPNRYSHELLQENSFVPFLIRPSGLF